MELYLVVKPAPALAPIVKQDIWNSAKFTLRHDIGIITPDARLKDPAKIEADIAARKAKAQAALIAENLQREIDREVGGA